MTTALQGKSNDFNAMMQAASGKLKEVAPKWLSVERLTRLALAARSRNPGLAECSADSYLLFCMKCAETGLEPVGAGGAWPVPFKNKHTGQKEVQFIPDWRGLIYLAKKSGQIKHAYGEVVRENDEVDYQKGDNPALTHKPALKNRGNAVGAYCIIVLSDGSKHIEYMSEDEIELIRKRSKAGDSGPWVSDWAQMAIKTVVKRALKPFASSPEMQTAIEYDNSAVGLDLPDRTPIPMPKEKNVTAEVEVNPPKGPASGEKTASDQGVSAPAPSSFDKEAAIVEIGVLLDKAKATKIKRVMDAVGIKWDDGESWEQASDEKLKSLLSLLKC